ncbi:hypothetical protein ACFQGT_14025 [Natrialbaceae archaeon GCM10025810]|uniref:hypothetical protein n=1 Tax=Halovalidus salilacus TaxID=3075124 RepID=UPI003613587A
MSTPQENFEIALDDSSDADAREEAIGDLETANECARLEEIVRNDGLDDRMRERALEGLANPQCRPTLESVADGDDLDGSLTERAESLLEETADGTGGSP